MNIKAQNSATTVKLTAAKVFSTAGMLDGYLSYVKISSYLNREIVLRQYWVTPDGIEVLGTLMRNLNTEGTNMYKGKMVYSDVACTPVNP